MVQTKERPYKNEKLIAAREARNLTLAEAGHRSQISSITIWRWEMGLSKPTPRKRAALAKVYRCRIADLGV